MTVTNRRHHRRRRRAAFCLHIVKHIYLVLRCRVVVNPVRWIFLLLAHIIYITNLSRVPSLLSFRFFPYFSATQTCTSPFTLFIRIQSRTAERRDKRHPDILRLLAPSIDYLVEISLKSLLEALRNGASAELFYQGLNWFESREEHPKTRREPALSAFIRMEKQPFRFARSI